MKLLVLVNPSSNGGRARLKWRRYAALLPAHHAVILNEIKQARTLAAEAAGYDAVVACGGDGTVNAVADGVLKNPDRNLKFGVLYAGTSPDFCTFHRIPTEPRAAVACLTRGNVREIECLTANGNHFFCSCNLGMGANVASQANRLRPLLGNRTGTFCALIRNLLFCKRKTYVMNGMDIPECDHLLITRMPCIAGGLKLKLPELKSGEYAVWFLQKASFLKRLLLPWKLYRGKPAGTVEIRTGPITITAKSGGDIEYDGDPHGSLPLDIRVSGRTLKLISGDGSMKTKSGYHWLAVSLAPCLLPLAVFLFDLAGWIRWTPSLRIAIPVLFLLLCLLVLIKISAYVIPRLNFRWAKTGTVIALACVFLSYSGSVLIVYELSSFLLIPYRLGTVCHVDTSPDGTWQAVTTTGPDMRYTVTLYNLKNKNQQPFTVHTQASTMRNGTERKWLNDNHYQWSSDNTGPITFSCEDRTMHVTPMRLLSQGPGVYQSSGPTSFNRLDGTLSVFCTGGTWFRVPEPLSTQKSEKQ